MTNSLALIGVLLLTALGATTGGAEIRATLGLGPPFYFLARPATKQLRGEGLQLVVAAGCRDATAMRVACHIRVPEELQLMDGDTVVTEVPIPGEKEWVIRVRPTVDGTFTIQGWIRIELREGVHEGAFAATVKVTNGAAHAKRSETTVRESILKGQRYRYGTWWMIPLDPQERSVTEDTIQRWGQRARIERAVSAVCTTCADSAATDTVSFIAVVDTKGNVRDTQIIGRMSGRRDLRSKALVESARETLLQWRFEPARARDQTVSDWVRVDVPVISRR